MTRVFDHRGFTLGGSILAVVVIMAAVSLVWTPYTHSAMSVMERLEGPGWRHWLGTDHFGRDVLSMIMVGARNSLAVGAVAVGLGLAIGVPMGLFASVHGGWLDEGLGRVGDLAFAFPAILSAVMINALAGPGATNAIIAIGIFNIAVFARVARGATAQIMGREFVRAALALGRTPLAVALRHVLPNISSAIIVQATIQFALAILAEAALSYLGLGTQPPQPSWGKMLFDAQTFIYGAPGQAIFPGAMIALTVLGLNLMGDGLRDLLDPRLRILRLG